MTPHALLVLPFLIPLLTLAVCVVLSRYPVAQNIVSLLGSVVLLGAAVALFCSVRDGTVLATQFGSWRAPFGITFVADLLSGAMVLITAVMGVAVCCYSVASEYGSHRLWSRFHPLFHGMLCGAMGAFLTGDIFNLYVCFELLLISSFGLLVFQRQTEQLDGGVKYVTLNLVATGLFLMSVGFLYGLTGTLNMADLSRVVPTVGNQGLVITLSVLFLLAFGLKSAVFPLNFWLPSGYPVASPAIVAFFAAILTKVGIYCLLRVFTLIFPGDPGGLRPVMLAVAALTMVTGVLAAASHYDIRRILSVHIISQIGYMVLGVAIGTPLAVAGSILYVFHNIIVKANLFLISGVIQHLGGSFDLKRIGGLYQRAPAVAALFLISATSLAGIPPSSGFWGKLILVQAALQEGKAFTAFVALGVGLLTLFSMIKIWNEAFWKNPPRHCEHADAQWLSLPTSRRWAMLGPIIALVALTLTMGLYAEPFIEYSQRAANQLLQPTAYLDAVLGESAPATQVASLESMP